MKNTNARNRRNSDQAIFLKISKRLPVMTFSLVLLGAMAVSLVSQASNQNSRDIPKSSILLGGNEGTKGIESMLAVSGSIPQPYIGITTLGTPISQNLKTLPTDTRFAPGVNGAVIAPAAAALAQGGGVCEPPAETTTIEWNVFTLNGNWDEPLNWIGFEAPNGTNDVARFRTSFTSAVTVRTSFSTQVNGIEFMPLSNGTATAFTITLNDGLNISGVGITNTSGLQQNFVVPRAAHRLVFGFCATAGAGTFVTNVGSSEIGGFGGRTEFKGMSTAGQASFFNGGGTMGSAQGGLTQFVNNTTAGQGSFFSAAGAAPFALGGSTEFFGSSSGGNASFFNFGASGVLRLAGSTLFADSSTAANATVISNGSTLGLGGLTTFTGNARAEGARLIANNAAASGGDGGRIEFLANSTGGTSRLEVFGNGVLEISRHAAPGVTIGSIEGNGSVFLGANNLTVGSNNRSTTFSGVIQDGGVAGGSLTKIGTGTLVLNGANTYTGGTTISDGVLQVDNTTGSGTGTGLMIPFGNGTLSGNGVTSSPVRVGAGGFISPGGSIGTLTIENTLALDSGGTYKFELNSSTALADKLLANGVTINGATFSLTDLGAGTLTLGTVFVILDNTFVSPIEGTFSNLAEGSTFTSNGNTFRVSYEGGTGDEGNPPNDLTLTVVAAMPPPTPGGCETPSFGTASNFGAGSFPGSVAVGDFNLDGKPDLAMANLGSNDVSILLGNGMGSFTGPTNFGVGNAPVSIAVADFNLDGKPDLAVANFTSNNVSILLGDGMGNFSTPSNFGAGTQPRAVAVGDFSLDGKLDLAVANAGSNNVSILLGDGMGNFSAPGNFGAGLSPFSVAVGDFNLDGKPDLAVANAVSNNVSILLGNGTGGVTGPTNFAAGDNPFSIAVGDFNLDGKPDLAVTNSNSDNVSVLLGNGTGGFTAPTNLSVGDGPTSVAVGDFNRDGKPDLAGTNANSDNI